MSDPEPYDPNCGKYASDMSYIDHYREPDQSRADYIRSEEGTYNPSNGHFACDPCYISVGMPSSERGWKQP